MQCDFKRRYKVSILIYVQVSTFILKIQIYVCDLNRLKSWIIGENKQNNCGLGWDDRPKIFQAIRMSGEERKLIQH